MTLTGMSEVQSSISYQSIVLVIFYYSRVQSEQYMNRIENLTKSIRVTNFLC